MANNPNLGQIQIDFIAKDFNSVVDALITFATAEFGPGTPSNRLWTNFNVDSFSRTWLELVAFVSDIIFFYLDNQSTEAYLASATLRSSVLKIAQQFGFVVPTSQSAGGVATFTTTGPTTIPQGFRVASTGGVPFFTTQAGSRGNAGTLDIPVIQGVQALDAFSAQGLQNEEFLLSSIGIVIDTTNVVSSLRSPIVTVNSVLWSQVETFIDSFGNSNVYQISLKDDGTAVIRFGDGLMGRQLTAGDAVQVSYRTGGGTIGNISKNTLTALTDSAANVISVTNALDFSGGSDAVTIDQLRDLIPASLSTLERAVTPQDHADLILLNFPQVAKASASITNTQTGIDLNIYVVPVGNSVTPITGNPNLLASIGAFLRLRKMVTSQIQLLNGFNLALQIQIRAFLNQNATQSVVSSNISAALSNFFNFTSGTISPNGTGPTFAQVVKLSDVYNVIASVEGLSRFEIIQMTYKPRVSARSVNINPLIFSDIQALANAQRIEYFIVTETVPPNVDGSSIGQLEVFQRENFTVSNITDNTINDVTADFSVVNSQGQITGNVIKDVGGQVFSANQYARGFVVVDSNNSIFQIQSNGTDNITINPSPINPDGSPFANGAYSIVRDLRDVSSGGIHRSRLLFNGQNISILYNNKNTLFVITGSQLLNLGTLSDPFTVSTKLTDPIIRSNVVDVTGYPTIQLDPVLIDRLYMRFQAGQFSAYNPITGELDIADVVDLSSVVAGDQFVDFTGASFPILGNIVNTLGAKSFTIKNQLAKVGSFAPNSYNNVSGFVSVPDSVDLSLVLPEDVFIDASNVRYRILGGINNTPGSKGFDIQPGIGSINTTIGAMIYQGISQQNGLPITIPFTPISYTSGTGVVRVPDPVDLSVVSPGDVFVDFSNHSFFILGGINNTPGFKAFTIAAGQTVDVSGNGTIYDGDSTPRVVGLGTLSEISAGAILVDNAGQVGLIQSVDPVSNRVVLDSDSRKPVVGICAVTTPTQIPIPLISTSITPTALSDVFRLGVQLLSPNNKIIQGDLLVDQNGVTNEILEAPYVSFANPSPTSYTYSQTPLAVVVFNNTGAVGFTYNSVTGVITYASSVDLSAVDIGDQFRDGASVDFTISNIDYANNKVTIPAGQTVNTTPGAGAGGSIRNGSSRGLIQYSSPVDLSQIAIANLFRDGNGDEFVIETFSTALNILRIAQTPGTIGLSAGKNFGGSIRAYDRVQLKPGFTTPATGIGATVTRRYFSPKQEVTWKVSYNGLIARAGFLNIDELGKEPATTNVADQFTIRTSPFVDDVTNVRPEEIPTLNPADLLLDLRGGNT